MSTSEIISLIVTIIGIASFSAIFTILYSSYAHSQIAEIRSGKKDIEIIDEVIYDNLQKTKSRRKIMNSIRSFFFLLAMVIIVPLFVLSVVSRIKNTPLMIGNYSVMAVGSGSMSFVHEDNKDYIEANHLTNQFDTYDLIIIQKVNKASDLKLYDVIAYYDSTQKKNIIHRIVGFDKDAFITKGDAISDAAGEDIFHPTINDIVGKYTSKRIKGIGIMIIFFQSYAGIITIMSLIYCLVMIDRYSNKINVVQDKRAKLLEDAINYSTEEEVKSFEATYTEIIYYKGMAYYFDEKGFVDKKELEENDVEHNLNKTIIKEITNKDTSQTISKKIIIEDENEEEEND